MRTRQQHCTTLPISPEAAAAQLSAVGSAWLSTAGTASGFPRAPSTRVAKQQEALLSSAGRLLATPSRRAAQSAAAHRRSSAASRLIVGQHVRRCQSGAMHIKVHGHRCAISRLINWCMIAVQLQRQLATPAILPQHIIAALNSPGSCHDRHTRHLHRRPTLTPTGKTT